MVFSPRTLRLIASALIGGGVDTQSSLRGVASFQLSLSNNLPQPSNGGGGKDDDPNKKNDKDCKKDTEDGDQVPDDKDESEDDDQNPNGNNEQGDSGPGGDEQGDSGPGPDGDGAANTLGGCTVTVGVQQEVANVHNSILAGQPDYEAKVQFFATFAQSNCNTINVSGLHKGNQTPAPVQDIQIGLSDEPMLGAEPGSEDAEAGADPSLPTHDMVELGAEPCLEEAEVGAESDERNDTQDLVEHGTEPDGCRDSQSLSQPQNIDEGKSASASVKDDKKTSDKDTLAIPYDDDDDGSNQDDPMADSVSDNESQAQTQSYEEYGGDDDDAAAMSRRGTTSSGSTYSKPPSECLEELETTEDNSTSQNVSAVPVTDSTQETACSGGLAMCQTQPLFEETQIQEASEEDCDQCPQNGSTGADEEAEEFTIPGGNGETVSFQQSGNQTPISGTLSVALGASQCQLVETVDSDIYNGPQLFLPLVDWCGYCDSNGRQILTSLKFSGPGLSLFLELVRQITIRAASVLAHAKLHETILKLNSFSSSLISNNIFMKKVGVDSESDTDGQGSVGQTHGDDDDFDDGDEEDAPTVTDADGNDGEPGPVNDGDVPGENDQSPNTHPDGAEGDHRDLILKNDKIGLKETENKFSTFKRKDDMVTYGEYVKAKKLELAEDFMRYASSFWSPPPPASNGVTTSTGQTQLSILDFQPEISEFPQTLPAQIGVATGGTNAQNPPASSEDLSGSQASEDPEVEQDQVAESVLPQTQADDDERIEIVTGGAANGRPGTVFYNIAKLRLSYRILNCFRAYQDLPAYQDLAYSLLNAFLINCPTQPACSNLEPTCYNSICGGAGSQEDGNVGFGETVTAPAPVSVAVENDGAVPQEHGNAELPMLTEDPSPAEVQTDDDEVNENVLKDGSI